MEKDRSSRIIAIVALMVGVVGLTIGFAAFSNNLTISSSASVSPDSSAFNVDFSSSSSSLATSAVTPVVTGEGATATNATIDNSTAGAPTITNLSATFSEPNQKAVYTFYARNEGEYIAYLKSISFAEVESGATKKCTPGADTTASLVASACNGISLSVKVGNEEVTTTNVATITGHSLAKAASEPIVVTIEYADGSAVADGDFTVSFGDISLLYKSVD